MQRRFKCICFGGAEFKMDESFGHFFDGAARDPTTIFSNTSMFPAHAASDVNCHCTFSRMNFNDINALDVAAPFGLGTQSRIV
jgi:hypothetical protein